jgi:hypothetical protein
LKRRHTVLQIEKLENLTEISYNNSTTTIVQDKIRYRKKRVNQLRLCGYTNQQIAEQTGYNLSTVEKDLHDIRELSKRWYEEDSIIEYCQSLSDSIILYDNGIEELQILYLECTDVDSKLKILAKISEFEERKIELYAKTKAVQNYLMRSTA